MAPLPLVVGKKYNEFSRARYLDEDWRIVNLYLRSARDARSGEHARMLFTARGGRHSGSLRKVGGVQSCVLISCPEVFSPITNCPITQANCAKSANCRATIR